MGIKYQSITKANAFEHKKDLDTHSQSYIAHKELIEYLNDVKHLKNLTQQPKYLDKDPFEYYVEPIYIEYFLAKEKKFVKEVKYLYIDLFDPIPEKETHIMIHNTFKKLNQPIDVIEVMNYYPQYLTKILDYYGQFLNFHEKISMQFQDGMKGDPNAILKALYFIEVLRKKEPTLAVLEILGDYIHYNINWCIRFLNKNGIPHSLEDTTVRYLIRNCEDHNIEINKKTSNRFKILSQLYMEQAFPEVDIDIISKI